jgi:anti-sigma B factor antagonist
MERTNLNDIGIITLTDRIDVEASDTLEALLNQAIDEKDKNICIDMTGVKFICSSALGVLIVAKRKLVEHDGDIKIVLNNENIIKLFKVTNLDKIFKIYATRDDCMATY